MPHQTLICTREDEIAIVTLNRPDRMNALTAAMEAELRDAMEAAQSINIGRRNRSSCD